MKITIAKTAGFCYGVNRAVDLVEKAIAEGKKAVTFGPIAHNRHLVRHFEELGVKECSRVEDIPEGYTVIIRSHGIDRATYEAMKAGNVEIIDATCPSVKRIHTLVAAAEEKGRQPVIIGTPTHPEIVAIAGWCEHPLVFPDDAALKNWLDLSPGNAQMPLTMVSQTTSTQFLWESCKKIAKKVCTNLEIFDTICRATENRQTEAAELAAKCDAMIVVGDRNSSNTGRLVHICAQHCGDVSLVDCADELDLSAYRAANTIGITAGASTPAWIIKEVNKTMSENTTVDVVVEESFEAMLENSIKTLNTGDKV
ncbi:MAG: 4-hydroxy-3-methylbut-2-enyl diphosphate reductase, partial [Oscillospiraceae bacterium]|nr:4-hydroxy-3-methylbut-2-enyl diphosphate reductase [Oscillospiraceae bacterium]